MARHYVLQPSDRVWLPEIGLVIGRDRGTYCGRTREWLYWYDHKGNRLLTPEELAMRERGNGLIVWQHGCDQ